MKVILFEKRFWELIVCGHKVHTIRQPRKRPINPGDALSLRGWEGAAYRSKQRVLAEETCVAVRDIWIDAQGIVIDQRRLDDPDELNRFAVSDGFSGWAELLSFTHFCRKLPFAGEMIQWGVHPMLKALGDFRG